MHVSPGVRCCGFRAPCPPCVARGPGMAVAAGVTVVRRGLHGACMGRVPPLTSVKRSAMLCSLSWLPDETCKYVSKKDVACGSFEDL